MAKNSIKTPLANGKIYGGMISISVPESSIATGPTMVPDA